MTSDLSIATVSRRKRTESPPDGLTFATITLFALGLLSQLLLLGANTRILAAFGATISIASGLAVLLLVGRSLPTVFWTRLAWVGVPFAAALAAAAYAVLPGPQASPVWLASLTHAAAAPGGSLTSDATALEISKWLGLAAIFAGAAAIGARPKGFVLGIEILIEVVVVQAVVGLILYGMDPFTVAGLEKGAHRWRFTGTFLNANAAGCVFAMAATMAMALANAVYSPRARPDGGFFARGDGRIWSGLAAFFLAGACALTGSRLALALMALAAVVLTVRGGAVRQVLRLRRSSRLILLLPMAVIAVGVLFAGPRALERTADLGVSATARFDTQRLVVDLIRQAPISGYGLGAFGDVYQARLGDDHATDMWNLGAAHNALLQMALEGGLIFAGAMVTCLALIWARVIGSWRTVTTNSDIRLGVALAVLIAGVTSCFDIVLNVPAAASLSVALSGLLWGVCASQPIRESVRP